MRKSLVVTTIASPNECLSTLASEAVAHAYDFICIGDKKSPDQFQIDGCEFYSVARQQRLQYSLVDQLPWNHYSRKNLGYLIAIENGCKKLLETDDDNYPENSSFWNVDISKVDGIEIVGQGWINIYSHFGVDSWPRGFPLEKIQEPVSFKQQKFSDQAYIIQSLVNGDPDVDAVFRLTRGLGISFGQYQPVALGVNVWCPFNSQNTLWKQEAFPLLYLPVTCSFRATDIVRSYVAQRCLWEMGGRVVFSGANAKQIRNEHNLLKDFEEEIVIYLKADIIRQELSKLHLRKGEEVKIVLDNLIQCYRKLVDLSVVNEQELAILKAWVKDINQLS